MGAGHLPRQEEEHVPLCVQCLELLLTDVRAFGDGMAGERLDSALSRMFGLSRTRAAELIADGVHDVRVGA